MVLEGSLSRVCEVEPQGRLGPFEPLIGVGQQQPAAGELRMALYGRLQKWQSLESLPLAHQVQGFDVVLEGLVELPRLDGRFGRLALLPQLAVELGQLGVVEGILGVRPGGQLQRFQGGGGAAGGAFLLTQPEEDGGVGGGQPAGDPELLIGVFLASLDSQQHGIEQAKPGLAGVDLDSATGVLHRQVQTLLDQVEEGQPVVDSLVAVSEPDGLLKVADGVGEPSLPQIGLPQAAMSFRVQRL